MNDLRRNIGQKVAFSAAIACLALAVSLFGIFVWLWQTKGLNDTWTPSALTTAFFLGFCAVVLYVMSRPKPPLPVDSAAS